MPTIVAIGGGELKDSETLLIDKAIVNLSKKKHPKVLFIPTASNDAEGYWEVFQKMYGGKLGCKTECLRLIKESPSKKEISEKILSADIIYVGGGNTLKMLKVWREHRVDSLLREAHKRGVIMAGLSAGAICWFRFGASDSRRFMNGKQQDMLMRVRGLDLVPCTVSPHHIREKLLRDRGLQSIMGRTSGIALAIDDNAAILIQDDIYQVLTSKKASKIHKVFSQGGKIKSLVLASKGSTEELLRKG